MLIPGLIAVWVVALGWYAVAEHSGGGRSEHSIGSFERQLRGLRSHGGLLVSPANRLSFPGEARSTVSVSSASFRHAEINRRRRNVLGALLGSSVLFALLGLVTQAAIVWTAFAVSAAAVCFYAYALAQVRAQAARRTPAIDGAQVYSLAERRNARAA